MNRFSIVRLSVLIVLLLLAPLSVLADEDQSINPPDELMYKNTPVLSPEEALKSFQVEEGFEVQLVASEPMVNDPVCMAWDEDGRLWVCEMTTYMQDQFAKTEEEPKGKIVILEDLNGDGVFDEKNDKHTVFLDGIILPRAIAFAKGGVLFSDFEKLYFVKINSNGTAGFKQTVDATYANDGKAKSNVEHQANGLLYGLDNWYYNAKSTRRYMQSGVRFRVDKQTEHNLAGGTEFRGQWGITQDDDGRILANNNSVLIMYELLPPSVTKRNPNFKFNSASVRVGNKVWPSHPTPGVNRGYQKGVVDHQTWVLKTATAACGPEIYRGTQFPSEYYNNVFVPEPAGNLVKHIVVGDDNGKPTAAFAYEGKEFLTSSDERNRFVNTYTGPDGALYLVDMYRGLFQHQTYITDYLRRQVNARKLDNPIGYGRIYRVVHKESPIDHTTLKISEMDSVSLVDLLGHPNAWQRHTAQRMLVQRGDTEAVSALDAMATTSDNPQARIHALWTLSGLGELKATTLLAAGSTDNQRVRTQVVRLSETFEGESTESRQLVKLMAQYGKESPNWSLDMQIALSAGILASIENPEGYDVLLAVMERRGNDKLFLGAIISGLRGKEAVMLAKVEEGPIKKMLVEALGNAVQTGDLTIGSLLELVDSKEFEPQRNDLFKTLSAQAVEQDRINVVNKLVDKLGSDAYDLENKKAILEGMTMGGQNRASPMGLNGKPDVFTKLEANAPEVLKEFVAKLNDIFKYERIELSQEDLDRIAAGSLLFGAHCSTCHGEDAQGLEGAGPPLSPSNWANADPKLLAALVLNGVEGPIKVNGKLYEPPAIQTVMSGFKNAPITDQDIADILTFIRSAQFGNHSGSVDPAIVTEMREFYKNREQPLTPSELLRWDPKLRQEIEGDKPPVPEVAQASWLDHSSKNLVITLMLVAGPLLLLLVGTLFGALLPKP